ncbi:MAG TPA: hypothetical protein VGM01_14920, partial [Ktedonobacteraceae bacterium]
QLMESPHDGKYLKHLLRGPRILPPVLSAKDNLRDPLSRAKAVVNGTTTKAPRPEMRVNTATKVCSQVGTGLPGMFIDREVHRG